MNVERISVKLAATGGFVQEGVFEFDRGDQGHSLSLRVGADVFSAGGSDYFESLCAIRRQLSQRRLQPICYGASRNVFPSGMARDMGAGLKAYKLTRGAHGSLSNIVGIFDTGPDVEPVSVEEQSQFYNEWLKSIGISCR